MNRTWSRYLAIATVLLAAGCDGATPPPEEIPYAWISAGWLNHTCAVSADGTAYCWGGNNSAQLGGGPDLPLADRFSPVEVAGDHAFSTVSAGGLHTCALDAAGRAYCWGSHRNGQLGTGSPEGPNTCRGAPCAAAPVAVQGALEFTAISAGSDHTCGLASTGEIHCWGANHSGQLGDGQGGGPNASSSAPVRVESGLTFVAVSAGERHSCALAEDGGAHCWGENLRAQIGTSAPDTCTWEDGASVPCSTTPLPAADGLTMEGIASGGWHTCAVATDRSTYCWGAAHSGQLGTEPDSVALRCGSAEQAVPCSPEPVRVSGGLAFRSIHAGGSHGCGILQGGEVYCWGGNLLGQLGDGSFRAMSAAPRPVSGDHGFARLSAGGGHTCAISDDRTAYCWGRNDSGQLGTAVGSAAYGPVRVTPPEP